MGERALSIHDEEEIRAAYLVPDGESKPHFRADTKRTSAGKLSPFALEYS